MPFATLALDYLRYYADTMRQLAAAAVFLMSYIRRCYYACCCYAFFQCRSISMLLFAPRADGYAYATLRYATLDVSLIADMPAATLPP